MKKILSVLCVASVILLVTSCSDKAKSDAEQTYQDTKESVNGAADATSVKIEENANKAQSELEGVKNDINQNAQQTKESIDKAVAKASDKIENKSNEAKSTLDATKQDVKTTANNVKSKLN